VSVESVERKVGFEQAVESHFTSHATAYSIEGLFAEHSAQCSQCDIREGVREIFFSVSGFGSGSRFG
jgi:hypothetical protein